jgi:NADH/NAD ratio-sensing transcriptional regulator Rex
MGINKNAGIRFLLEAEGGCDFYYGKSMLMLGKQDVGMTYHEFTDLCTSVGFQWIDHDYKEGNIDSVAMFQMMGFSKVYSLDVSDYEGADIIFNLNCKELLPDLIKSFDYIYNGGTLEHIFDFAAGLINTSKMLKENGIIIHDIPCHNWMDHGFYTISPTLFIDYYQANKFMIKSIYLLGLQDGKEDIISADCRYNDNKKFIHDKITEERVLMVCIAKKMKDSSESSIPTQSYYTDYERNRFYGKYNKNEKIESLIRILSGYEDKSVAIYGVGDTTYSIIKACQQDQVYNSYKKLSGIYSRDNSLIGHYIDGLKILDINNVHDDKISYIVIGSLSINTEEIYRRLKYLSEQNVKIIRLCDV